MRAAKVQINLQIYAVWSGPSLQNISPSSSQAQALKFRELERTAQNAWFGF